MTPDDQSEPPRSSTWIRVRQILADAAERPHEDRAAFVAAACTGEPHLQAEVESLLEAMDRAPEILSAIDPVVASSLFDARDEELSMGTRIGPYGIRGVLGRGGMGIVYLADDTRLDRTVALKFLPPHLSRNEDARARIEAEAKSAAALDHPNVAVVHEIGEAEAGIYIAMAFYEGSTLRETIDRQKLKIAEIVDLARQIAAGLRAAHRRGIVHRDIKPSNVVVTLDGVAKILDFGIARSAGDNPPEEEGTPGTAAYMSPEQVRGEAVDHRTDLWSFGVVLYEMLAGARPFRGSLPADVTRAILHEPPAPLALPADPAARRLAAVVERCLEKDPQRRCQDADELLAQLEESDGARAELVAPAAPRWQSIVAVLGGLALVVASATAGLLYRSRPADPGRVTHLNVSTFDGSHRSPSLSPDGQQVAFLMDADGVAQVWIARLDGGRPVQLTSGAVPAVRPRWSPRGGQILFGRRAQGIWAVAVEGGSERQIIEHGRSPNFAADGSTIVFETDRASGGTRWELRLANADGTNIRTVQGVPDKPFWDEPSFPALSPDGQWIAFFRHSAGPRGDLWIVPAAGGEARQLTHDEREGGAPCWAGDGSAVVFPSQRRGSRTLWRVSLSGGTVPMTTGAGIDDEPDVSRDGERLVYVNRRDRSALTLWDPSAGSSRTIAESASLHWMPEVSPAGDHVAFFADVAGTMHVFTIGTDGSNLRQVTTGAVGENIHPSWSADGSSIYYYGHRDDAGRSGWGWRRIPVHGGPSTLVAAGWQWLTHSNAQVHPSNGSVLYTRVHTDTGDYARDTTYVRDLASGEERTVEAPHQHMARWSPDGRYLAGHRHDGTIALCDEQGRRCRTLTKGQRPAWSRDGRHVYFQRDTTANSASVWRIEFATGREEPIGRIESFHSLSPTLSATPDHRLVYTDYRVGRSELWLMQIR